MYSIDSEASMTDLSLGKTFRLIFFGSGGILADCSWLNNKTFIIVGFGENIEYDNQMYIPILYYFELEEMTVSFYENKSPLELEQFEYFENKFRSFRQS
jgi:hypothetical protein